MAGRVDAAFFLTMAVLVFFTTLIAGLIIVFAIRYRRGSRAYRGNPVSNSHRIEALWIGIPLVLAVLMFAAGSRGYFELYNPPKDADVIYVVGKQWMWYLQHPEGKREQDELHVPLGRPVRLVMTSQDVIHSFYVPAFRIKQDVLPGRFTSTWFEPTKIGTYHLYCAEYCGTNHSGMIGTIHVMKPEDYQDWLEHGSIGPTMATRGARLFVQYDCNGCHGPNSTTRAPALEGVFGGPVPIQEGNSVRMITADETYIRDSIKMPKSQVVAGYDPVMPSYEGRINERDLFEIIAYIKSIGRKEGSER